ncbi:MAG: hypothetical protein ACI9H8_001960 [Lysobacterales bacterium]|jgi:hypothetical protein
MFKTFHNHLAFWFVTVFATPLFIAVNNPADIVMPLVNLGLGLFGLCIVLAFLSSALGRLTGQQTAHRFGLLMLGFAMVLAIQGNVVHDLFEYGSFNGQAVNFRSNGQAFRYEWFGFLAGLFVITLVLQWARPKSRWLAALPILSSCALLIPSLLVFSSNSQVRESDETIDPAVFNFSQNGNLIHLLPDGFQSDIAQQVLEEHPELASRFEGFTLFANHLGMFQGTAPSVPTILTGIPFDLNEGHDYQKVIPHVQAKGYPRRLKAAGYRLDYALISNAYCAPDADSCVSRPFNDMKARGYYRHESESQETSLRILADLSLFRLTPMHLKEKIYDDGHWFLSDNSLDGSSPWPDPIIREWSEKMQVTDGPPVFKYYHYIGTHIPPHWDADCNYQRSLERSRENYLEQTYCVLQGIAGLIEALKSAGIYDETAIIITGDHGCGIAPADELYGSQQTPLNSGLMGSARPAFMIKEKNNKQPLKFSRLPTSLMDIAPTALALSGLVDSSLTGSSVFDLQENTERERNFLPYLTRDLFSGNPVPHQRYSVGNDVRDSRSWLLKEITIPQTAPSSYDPVNYRNGDSFVLGVRYSVSEPDKEATWINGRQLAFLISVPKESEGVPELEFAFHLPKWIPEQTMKLSVNGQVISEAIKLEMGKGYWNRINISLAGIDLKPINNFVSAQFSFSALPPGIEHFEVSALLRSIHLKMKPASDTNKVAVSRP